MTLGSLGLAFLAGVVSTLSPCVLPLLPVVLGASSSEHRFGPLALTAGLALSFTAIGLFLATIGFGIGLDAVLLRGVAALALVSIGVVLLVPAFQVRFATAMGPVSGWIEGRAGRISTRGIEGQFALGFLLGAVWTPCVGPTLGAASLLAAQGESLATVALVMAIFGLGAALPLLILGQVSRTAMQRLRDRLLRAGQGGKAILGGMLLLVGLMVLSGLDKRLEAILVEASPEWLTHLTTRF